MVLPVLRLLLLLVVASPAYLALEISVTAKVVLVICIAAGPLMIAQVPGPITGRCFVFISTEEHPEPRQSTSDDQDTQQVCACQDQ